MLIIKEINLKSDKPLPKEINPKGPTDQVMGLCWGPISNNSGLTVSTVRGGIRFLDGNSWEFINDPLTFSYALTISWHPSFQQLYARDFEHFFIWDNATHSVKTFEIPHRIWDSDEIGGEPFVFAPMIQGCPGVVFTFDNIAVHPSGDYVAIASDLHFPGVWDKAGNQICQWDVNNNHRYDSIKTQVKPFVGVTIPPIIWHPQGHRLIYADRNLVEVYNFTDRKWEKFLFNVPKGEMISAFCFVEKNLWIGTYPGRLRCLDWSSGQEIPFRGTPYENIDLIQSLPSLNRLFILHSEGISITNPMFKGSCIDVTVDSPNSITLARVSSDLKFLALIDAEYKLWILDFEQILKGTVDEGGIFKIQSKIA